MATFMKAMFLCVALWGGTLSTVLAQFVTFANTNSVVIRDSDTASLYPSPIVVSNATWRVGRASLTLSNLSHTAQSDVNVLLVGPNGLGAYVIAGPNGTMDYNHVTLTIDDTASAPIPGDCGSGSYQPTGYIPEIHELFPTFPSPAPSGPYSSDLSIFNGVDPNGAWSLFILDDEGGDSGILEGGWSLRFDKLYPLELKSKAAGQIEVSWPTEAEGYILISSSDLHGDNWSVIPNVPAVEGLKKVVRLPVAGPSPRFFKLIKI